MLVWCASKLTDPFEGDGWMFRIISCSAMSLCYLMIITEVKIQILWPTIWMFGIISCCALWLTCSLTMIPAFLHFIFRDNQDLNIQTIIFVTTFAESNQIVDKSLPVFFRFCYFVFCATLQSWSPSFTCAWLIGWLYIAHTAFLTSVCKRREKPWKSIPYRKNH